MFKTFAVSFALLATVSQATVIHAFPGKMPSSGGVPEVFRDLSSDLPTSVEDLDVLNTRLGYSLAAGDIQFEVEPSTERLFTSQTLSFTQALPEPLIFSWGAFTGFGTYQMLQYPLAPDYDSSTPDPNYGPLCFGIAGLLIFASRRRKQALL